MAGTWRSTFIILCSVSVSNAFITGLAVRLPLQGPRAPPGSPWPMPQNWQKSETLVTLDPSSFIFQADVTGCDVIDHAFERYKILLVLRDDASIDEGKPILNTLSVRVKNRTCHPDIYPSLNMDEAYNLTIPGTGGTATLDTNSVWGVRRGLETFSQLVHLRDEKWYQVNQTTIRDFPRFKHRGLMIDTARHFLPMSVIMDIMETMSYDKLNVLHWHVVDDQSFPYPLRTFPNMTELGSYSPSHRYSREDVDTILKEARLRGIRVIPEFDTPGHTFSWGKAFPEIITPCWANGKPYQAIYNVHGEREILNPIINKTYEILDAIYREVQMDFPEEYVHLGLDEIYHACWQSNPNVTDWMRENGMNTTSQLEQYYERRLIDIVTNTGAKSIIWQDPISIGVEVQPDTIIEIWKGPKDPSNDPRPGVKTWQDYSRQAANLGYNMLLSSPWYLNYIRYGQDWKPFYQAEPHNFSASPADQELMLGGEACIWAEYVDGTNIFSRLGIRLSAVAERLWSPKEFNDVDEAQFRLDQHRCRFVRRGYAAQPLINGYCGDYDFGFPRKPPPTSAPTSSPTKVSAGDRHTVTVWLPLLALVFNYLCKLRNEAIHCRIPDY